MDDMQRVKCAVGADRDGQFYHPFLRFGRRRSLLSFRMGVEEVLSRQRSLGRLEWEKRVERSCVVRGGWNEEAAGLLCNPL